MKIGIFIADSNGGYPVPASRGGAVSTLVEHLVKENNEKQMTDLDIITIYDEKAKNLSRQYPNIKFIWMKPWPWLRFLDKLLFECVRVLLKNRKATSYKSLFSLLFCIIQSSGIIKKNSYDKVVLENNSPLAWAVRLSKIKGNYYYHFHNVPRIDAGCRTVFENCTGFLCVSQYVAKQIRSETSSIGAIPESKIKVLYNCIDTKQYCPLKDAEEKNRIRKIYGIGEKDKLIVFVGRLSEEKGIDKVIEAVQLLHREDIKLLIAGGLLPGSSCKDEYQKKLYEMAKNSLESVIFTGYISQDKIQRIYQIADVAVLPSIWEEPAGLTMVEAIACGIPVITTDSGGIPEYMGKHAIVLRRNEILVKNISEKIEQLLKRNELSIEDNINYVIKNYDSATYLERFIECLV